MPSRTRFCFYLCVPLSLTVAASPLLADSDEDARHPSKLPRDEGPATPDDPEGPEGPGMDIPSEKRSSDGRANNPAEPYWGGVQEVLLRLIDADYEDGVSAPSGSDRPSARAVSNAVAVQTETIPNRRGASDFLWQWGQFLDHDIVHVFGATPPEPFPIEIPPDDPWFGEGVLPFNRSASRLVGGVREQINSLSAFIDASNVYGSGFWRAMALRAHDGTGRLKTSPHPSGDLLPYNVSGFPNAQEGPPRPAERFFFAGDTRANEQVGLTAMHTLFVREHNYWAEQFGEMMGSKASGEERYQFARLIVGAEMQAITYREFLPLLLGPGALPEYGGYQPDLNPGITNLFNTVGYRLGHSMLSPTLLRLDRQGREIPAGHLRLADAFFDPSHIERHGIDPVLRGLAKRRCQEIDTMIVDDVRNMLFGPPREGGGDLAALNIQRGRDHGIPSYVAVRAGLDLPVPDEFSDINPDPAVWERLASVYDEVEDVDPWIGALSEPHLPGSMTGPTMHRILVDQFVRLRDGDRFFYRSFLPPTLLRFVENQTLARIIRRNTSIARELQDDVFMVNEAVFSMVGEGETVQVEERKAPTRKASRLRKGRRAKVSDPDDD